MPGATRTKAERQLVMAQEDESLPVHFDVEDGQILDPPGRRR